MGRNRSVEGGRPVVVSVRLSEQEAAALDFHRGRFSRSEWVRQRALEALVPVREFHSPTPPGSIVNPVQEV